MSKTLNEQQGIAITSSNPLKILHVDDDTAFLEMVKQCLELHSDMQVQSAHSIKEALKLIEKSEFDVIISGYQMEERNGLDFLKELKLRKVTIPFILFTSKEHDELAIKALDLGAFRYLRKGAETKAAYAELESCIKQAVTFSKADDLLKRSEKKFQAVFDSTIDAILIMNNLGEVVYSNKSAKLMLDFAREEITKKVKEHFEKQLSSENGKFAEVELKKKSGEILYVDMSFSSFKENGRTFRVSILRDISERKKQEVLLAESQQTLKALFSYNPEAIVFTDINRNVTDVNQIFSELFGYTLDQIKGKNVTDLIVPSNKQEESKMMFELLMEGPVSFNTERKKSDGSVITVNISGGPLIVNNKILGYFMMYVDISDVITVQNQLEKALSKAELLNEKIEVLGGFTRHDVRNKLALIQGNLYLASRKCKIDPQTQKYFQEIESTVKSITDIFDFAKTYEMLGVEDLALVNLGHMVQNAVYLFSDLRNVKIVNQCENVKVKADSLLTQVFYNLIDDSLKYGQKITTITVNGEKIGESTFKLFYKDDGVGIEEQHKRNIFKKGYGRGTGFGLYLIQKIIDVYGWTVEENGHFGEGVQFEFTIPLNKTKQC
ncbi:MAG: PAS domain S-box protein [Candidatus Bathyarchaeia archaeon]|jgi:PAS domain S-box-containing protein